VNNLRNEKLLETFGKRVRKLRIEKNLTLEELAFACDIELSQVHRIEKGKVNITLSTMEVLAKGLETSIGKLLQDF